MDVPRPYIIDRTAHYRCPAGCGWAHTEPTDPGPARMLIDPAEVGGSLNLHTETRGLLLQDRVARALADHLRGEHPEAVKEWET